MELMVGTRPRDFDVCLERVPSVEELGRITNEIRKPILDNLICDLDGTLVPPYEEIIENSVAELIGGYTNAGKKFIIFTHSKPSARINKLRDAGALIAETHLCKPSLDAYQEVCMKHGCEPGRSGMIGNFPVTDMPLVERGQPPFFVFNGIVESIPPKIGLRAKLFHGVSMAWTRIVERKNPNMLRSIPEGKIC
jgi:predicted HAD superfamily phosphohydrolase YqeG